MTLVFFLFVDGDAVLPDLAGPEFVSVELLRLGLGFLKLYWYLPPQSTKVNIIIINIDDTIIQLLLLHQRLPIVPIPNLLCLCICNIRGETKPKNRWHAILMHGVHFILVR